MTGQMNRDEALKRIAEPELSENFLKSEFEYVASKLDLSVSQLQEIFDGENMTYRKYRNKRFLIGVGSRLISALGLERRLFR